MKAFFVGFAVAILLSAATAYTYSVKDINEVGAANSGYVRLVG
jgi:hypothetical protein